MCISLYIYIYITAPPGGGGFRNPFWLNIINIIKSVITIIDRTWFRKKSPRGRHTIYIYIYVKRVYTCMRTFCVSAVGLQFRRISAAIFLYVFWGFVGCCVEPDANDRMQLAKQNALGRQTTNTDFIVEVTSASGFYQQHRFVKHVKRTSETELSIQLSWRRYVPSGSYSTTEVIPADFILFYFSVTWRKPSHHARQLNNNMLRQVKANTKQRTDGQWDTFLEAYQHSIIYLYTHIYNVSYEKGDNVRTTLRQCNIP